MWQRSRVRGSRGGRTIRRVKLNPAIVSSAPGSCGRRPPQTVGLARAPSRAPEISRPPGRRSSLQTVTTISRELASGRSSRRATARASASIVDQPEGSGPTRASMPADRSTPIHREVAARACQLSSGRRQALMHHRRRRRAAGANRRAQRDRAPTTSARSPSPRCRCAPIARSSPFTGAAVSLTSAGAPRFVALDAETAVKLDRTFAQVYRDGLESLRALVEGRARTNERAGRRRPLSRGPRRAASLGVASARAARSPHARICTGPQKATWLRILRIHGNGWRYVQAAPRSSLPSTLTL